MNRVIFFSGGLSSFAVADWVKQTYPDDNTVLYFTDTKWEDEDLYRFIYEVSDKLKLPLLIHSKGIDPVDLMIQQRTIYNSRIGFCSIDLKMRVAQRFILKGRKPAIETWYNEKYLKEANFREDAVLYFGIAFDEIHRVASIKRNWSPRDVEFPLTKLFVEYDSILSKYDIKKPELYLKGFVHNNCKGRCVKAGVKHFKNLYLVDRKSFEQLEAVEEYLSPYADTHRQWKKLPEKAEYLEHNFKEMRKWKESNYEHIPELILAPVSRTYRINKYKTMKQIREEMENGVSILPTDEIGGCGCFLE